MGRRLVYVAVAALVAALVRQFVNNQAEFLAYVDGLVR